jgi:teichuronic acid exporter
VVTVFWFWVRSDWYPQLKFSYSSIKEMLPYGSRILVVSLLFFLMLQFNTFIVGKLYSKTELGFFNRGGRLPDLLISIIQSIILKLAFPLFAKVRDEKHQLEEVLRKTTQLVAFISFPLLALMMVNAGDITVALFTAKWNDSIIFMELFCLITLFEPFVVIYRELILAKGNARLLMNIFLITSAGEILLVLWMARYGILFIVIASIISKTVQYVVYLLVSSRLSQISAKTQVEWIRPYLFISVIMGLLVKGLGYLLANAGLSLITGLVIKMAAGAVIYLALAYLLKLNELSLIRFFRQKLENKFHPRSLHALET